MKRTLLAIAMALPLAAGAQEAAPLLPEDPRASRYREVERGLFVGFEAGFLGVAKTLTQDRVKYPSAGAQGGFASGFVAGVEVGYDVTPRIAVSAFFLAGNATANASFGAFDLRVAGGDLRYAVPVIADANGVNRLFLYAHGRVGYLWSYPADLFTNTDLMFGVGAGAEYFTRLRHFSVGMAIDGNYLKDTKVFVFAIAPTLRYTF
jgi:hypothetical protein